MEANPYTSPKESETEGSESPTEKGNWWTRSCGGRDVMAIAWPMVMSTGSFSIMHFVDRMLLLWHSSEEMSAALPAGMLHWATLCFPFGVAQYVNTFVAQYVGAERPTEVGRIVWQGVYIAIATVPMFALMWPLSPWFFDWFGHPENIRAFEISYFRILLLAAPVGVAAASLSSFFIGRGETRLVMWMNIAQTIVNLVLDYVLVFGVGPFPEMGITGAGIATVISIWMKTAGYLWFMHTKDNTTRYRLDRIALDFTLLKRLFRFGGPNGVHFVAEAAAMTVALLFLGNLGAEALAATTLAFNVNSVAFVPMIGISIAVTTMVGQQTQRGRADLAARATWTALVLGCIYSGAFAIMYVACPNLFLLGHKMGADPAEFAAIQHTTVVLLRFVAAYCLFDTLQIIFVGTLKGAGDTLFVLLNTIVQSTLLVLVGWIGMRYFNGGLLWWWTAFTAWIFALGVTYCWRFNGGKWQTMSVIEPKLTQNDAEPTQEPAVV